ncbi:MAG: PA14 domain-containing protein [Fimbriimonadaceae bacterium]
MTVGGRQLLSSLIGAMILQTGFTSGATVWVWDVDGKLDKMPTVVEGQTPNIYSIVPQIDLKDGFEGQEGKLEDTFVGRAFGWLKVETAGRYRIRLTCDDGATLSINGREVLNTERGTGFVDQNTAELQSERIPFDLKFYENTGKFNLKLEWQKPGDSDFSIVPPSAFLSEAGQTFVVSPGIKRHFLEIDRRAPGDGRPVAGVHPSYRLETFRPENFKPQIGGMCFLPDGRSAICTWDQVGAVYIVEGLNSSSGQVKVKLFAEGLGEPLGIAYLDGDLWVTQKGEITRLRDNDKDGKADQFEAIASGWPASQNYHEFTFNLVPRGNKLYLATSVPLRGGWTYYNPGSEQAFPIPNVPGSILEIEKSTGKWSVFANGLRTPNGMGLGVDGEMFVSDNQGSWLPCSRINHVKRGGFYGHQLAPGPDSTPKPSEMKPELPADPPVVWLPHGEISNSPSEPVLVNEGPFKGQMFFGDVTYGGIQRMNVEKVNGVYQGAAFRFTQGLEAGVNRLAWGPDHKLYIGGIGSNGNWNHQNHRFGLQRLAFTGKSAFEMLSIKVSPTGFRVKFTEPVSRIGASNFEMTSFRYAPREFYGGPKLDVERFLPTGARLLASNEIELTMPLKKGFVYQFRLVDLKSAKGENPWSYEAWYTLNEVPKP